MSHGRLRHEGYEPRDATARPLFVSALVLALILAGALAASAWIAQRDTDALGGEIANPLAALRKAPDGPALEAHPAAELAHQRAWEEHRLTTTEWIDPLNKVVRIPVQDALELALREGFPTRPASGQGGK